MKHTIVLLLLTSLFIGCGKTEEIPLINGYELPELNLTDRNSQRVALSSLKGKMVLVEFWASWCKPCRDKHPELNRIYAEYKDTKFKDADGFEIYYVNLDSKKGDWLTTMQKDSIDHWSYHVADLRGMAKSDIPALFQFTEIPTAYLIDGEGVIIGKDLNEDRLFHKLKRRVLQ